MPYCIKTVSLRQEINQMTLLYILLFGMGVQEIIIILLIVLLLFGGKKIPELMKGLGRGVKDFKDASRNETSEGGEADKK